MSGMRITEGSIKRSNKGMTRVCTVAVSLRGISGVSWPRPTAIAQVLSALPCLLVTLCLLAGSCLFSDLALAEIPYRNYVYNFWGEAEPQPQAYLPAGVVSGAVLGVGQFRGPQDLFATDDGTIYVADTGNNRIVRIEATLDNCRVIDSFDNEGRPDRFSGPSSLFVTADGSLYIADTGNGRIVQLDAEGQLVRIISSPTHDVEGVLDANFRFVPTQVVVDRSDRIYVISKDTYDGILTFDAGGEFRGFVGAPRVTPSVADIIWSRLATREQRERQALFLPIEYVALDVDDRGFIYAAEAGQAESTSLKRLNPSGTDVLRRKGFQDPVGDLYPSEPSIFRDVTARSFGGVSVLDRRQGRVFTYNDNSEMLYVFGGIGQVLGTFVEPVAIDETGDKMLVLDSRTGLITIFEPTTYARRIHAALGLYKWGRYEQLIEIWEDVLAENANFDLAYTGMGRVLARNEQYRAAMDMFRLGNNREDYSDAFRIYREEWMERNLPTIALVLVALGLAGYALKRFGIPAMAAAIGRARMSSRQASGPFTEELQAVGSGAVGFDTGSQAAGSSQTHSQGARRRWRATLAKMVDGLRYSIHTAFHPFDGFWGLKYERRANLLSATVILLSVVLTYIVMRQYTGFVFNPWDTAELNIYTEFVSVLLPFTLWCVVNWSLTTLMNGKGSLAEIYMGTAYALVPIVLVNIPATILSNGLTLEEGSFYYLLIALSLVWAGVLMVVAVMTIHDYSGVKTCATCLLTVVGMAFCIFIGILFFSVINRLVAFASQVYTELVFRL